MILELLTVSVMSFGLFGDTEKKVPVDQETASAAIVRKLSLGPQTLEGYVREYFEDTPILAEVAKCESRFRHQNRDGSVFRGEVNRLDVGVMQINEYYHLNRAEKNGFDIYSLDGNLGYARWLYEKYATDPWVHSSRCWGTFEKLAMN